MVVRKAVLQGDAKCIQSRVVFGSLVPDFAGRILEVEIRDGKRHWPVDTGESRRCQRANDRSEPGKIVGTRKGEAEFCLFANSALSILLLRDRRIAIPMRGGNCPFGHPLNCLPLGHIPD